MLIPLIALLGLGGGGWLVYQKGHAKGHAVGAGKAATRKLTPDEVWSAAGHAANKAEAIQILKNNDMFKPNAATIDRLQTERQKAGLPAF
jgi:hypothetical protein